MKPGDIIPSWGDDSGLAIVVRTSRHKQALDLPAARLALAQEADGYWGFGEEEHSPSVIPKLVEHLEDEPVFRWHSVTKKEIEEGTHDCMGDGDCAPGVWCTAGQGSAWVDVLNIESGTTERITDEVTA